MIALFTPAKCLLLHGAIILLFGLMLGAPYAKAIKGHAPAHIVNSWRVAHASLPMGALMMLVFALALPHLAAAAWLNWVIAGSLIMSGYGFCIALPLAAMKGERGLQSSAGWGQVVYVGNIVGAAGSLVSSAGFLVAVGLGF